MVSTHTTTHDWGYDQPGGPTTFVVVYEPNGSEPESGWQLEEIEAGTRDEAATIAASLRYLPHRITGYISVRQRTDVTCDVVDEKPMWDWDEDLVSDEY